MAKGPMIVLPSQPAVVELACCRRLFVLRRRRGAGAAVFRRSRHRAARRRGVAPAGKLRVSGDKVRLETPELADGFFLIDGAKPAAYFVRPAARIFMDARQSSRLTRMFVPVDPDDPCRQWQAMAKLAGVRGAGRLALRTRRRGDDRRAQHHRLSRGPGSRARNSLAGSIRRANFRCESRRRTAPSSPPRIFATNRSPRNCSRCRPGLRKFDPQALIQQIKQSDVWVADEKDLHRSHR